MYDSDLSRLTGLSTTTLAFLIVFVPAILLATLIWLSYNFSSWT